MMLIETHHRLHRLYRSTLTPVGRHQLRRRLLVYRLWPRLRRAAHLHRRTLASGTRIVAVVGSLGKSTTAAAVAVALGRPPPRSHANAFGNVGLAVLRIRPWQRHAVVEIGIDPPGQMIRYAPMVRPDVVVVTAIASEHNRSFASLDAIRDEKALILRGLRRGGLVVLNGDDHRVRAMARSTDARILTFGFGADNDVRASACASGAAARTSRGVLGPRRDRSGMGRSSTARQGRARARSDGASAGTPAAGPVAEPHLDDPSLKDQTRRLRSGTPAAHPEAAEVQRRPPGGTRNN